MAALFQSFRIEGKSSEDEGGLHLLITGGVHGDEHEGIVACRQLLEKIDPVELSGTVTLIPVVNESAHALDARCGEDGLDLARTCPGRSDGSITERVAHQLAAEIERADLYIDLHSGGKTMQLDPLTGYMLVKDENVLSKQRRMARAFGLPVIWGTCGDLDGRSLSVARDAGVAAIYTEYLGGGLCSEEGVAAYFKGCLHVMSEFGMLPDRGKTDFVPELEIEDDRSESGHLQICHPSPSDGWFHSNVRLGQTVEKGSLFGKVDEASVFAETLRSGDLPS